MKFSKYLSLADVDIEELKFKGLKEKIKIIEEKITLLKELKKGPSETQESLKEKSYQKEILITIEEIIALEEISEKHPKMLQFKECVKFAKLTLIDINTKKTVLGPISSYVLITEWLDQDLYSIYSDFGDNIISPREANITLSTKICYIYTLFKQLEVIHQLGIIHNDLKPNNIMLNRDDCYSIKIIDFGLILTENSDIIYSTPYFSHPDIFRSNTKASFTHDLYAMSLVSLFVLNPFFLNNFIL